MSPFLARMTAISRAPEAVLALLLSGVLTLSLLAGDTWLSPPAFMRALVLESAESPASLVIWHARMPRVLLAMGIGAALSVAGLLMQTLSRNPLATPSILGIGNGAMLGLTTVILFVPTISEPVVIAASFAGAAVSAAMIIAMGFCQAASMDRNRIVIGGTILAALEGSVLTGVLFFHEMHNDLLGWTLGRLVHVDWAQALFVIPVLAVGLVLGLCLIPRLDAFQLGTTVATSLGVRVGMIQFGTLAAVVILAGGSVAAAGPVAFVGLIVPHVMRHWFAVLSPVRRLLACALAGAVLTCGADLLSRLTSDNRTIPLGIWTLVMGALFFLGMSFRMSACEETPCPAR